MKNFRNFRLYGVTAGLAIMLFFSSCAPTRMVKPLNKGEKTIGANFGGPMINFAGAIIPLPLTSVWGAMGIDSSTTAWASIHTTAAAFADFQTDLGFTRRIYTSQNNKLIPSVSISPVINFMHSFRDAQGVAYPEIDLNFYWDRGKHIYYLSNSNWFILSKTRAHGEPQTQHWLPTINLGTIFNREKTSYQIELRYLAPFNKNNSVVEYFSPLGTGALGIYFGVNFKVK